jgi:plastocyanin
MTRDSCPMFYVNERGKEQKGKSMIHMYVVLFLTTSLLAGCTHTPGTSGERTVRTVEISESVTPNVMYASPGEEVRWTNARSTPVRVGFLSPRLLEEHECQKGVVDMFGRVNDFITIPPGESISLCFVRSGDLGYNVWFDADNPRGSISPTMTIRVRGG